MINITFSIRINNKWSWIVIRIYFAYKLSQPAVVFLFFNEFPVCLTLFFQFHLLLFWYFLNLFWANLSRTLGEQRGRIIGSMQTVKFQGRAFIEGGKVNIILQLWDGADIWEIIADRKIAIWGDKCLVQ